MKTRVVAVIVAALLAAVGVVLLVNYANNADERAFGDAKLRSVLQVTETIDAGTNASQIAGKVETVKLPQLAIAKGALTDLDDVKGLSTTTTFEPGEQVLLTRFAKKGATAAPGNSQVPKGFQELTIALSEARVVGGIIKAGDRVGVVSSVATGNGDAITRLVKNQVLVTRIVAAGQDQNASGEGKPMLVTLAVKTSEAGKIINTAEYGKLWLTKQYPGTETGNGGFTSKIDLGQK